jgi:hypothetical protein
MSILRNTINATTKEEIFNLWLNESERLDISIDIMDNIFLDRDKSRSYFGVFEDGDLTDLLDELGISITYVQEDDSYLLTDNKESFKVSAVEIENRYFPDSPDILILPETLVAIS